MPTLEIYEKVGEITSVHLRTAEENKKIAIEEKARREEVARIQREEELRKNREKAFKISMEILEKINKLSDEGNTSLWLNWRTGTPSPLTVNFHSYDLLFPYIKEILCPLGYNLAEPYSYSASWTRKSGKIGYAWISWS